MEKLDRAQKCSILGPQNLNPPVNKRSLSIYSTIINQVSEEHRTQCGYIINTLFHTIFTRLCLHFSEELLTNVMNELRFGVIKLPYILLHP